MIGTVYKIEIYDKIYIGSTIMELSKRQIGHNTILKLNKRSNELYEECRKHNIEKIICIPLETKEIENDLEIRELEQEYIDKLKPLLNQKIAYTELTIKEQKNQRYIKNREDYLQKKKEEYKVNRENMLKKCKEYYEENKEKIKEKNKEKNKVINCNICNSIITKSSLKRHQKTKKCLNYSA